MNNHCNISRRSRGAFVRALHTAVEGRARYKINGLQGSIAFKKYLELNLSEVQGITQVSANPSTGNVLVFYQPGHTVLALAAQIERLVIDYTKQSHSSIVRAAKKINRFQKKAKKLPASKKNPVN